MTNRPNSASDAALPAASEGDAKVSDESRSSAQPAASPVVSNPDASQIGRDAAQGGIGDGADELSPQPQSVITAATAGGGGKAQDPAARRKLSDILAEIANDTSRQRISVGDLAAELQRRAFGAMLLIFALPNAVPTPPGTSAILGLPLLYLTFQLMMGHTPWLPKFISNRSMSRGDMASVVERISPMLQRAERLLVPRFLLLSSPVGERIVGALCLILAIVLVLPIPLGNMLPAFAISVMALGLLEKDGIWIGAGAVIGVLSLLIVWGVVYALAKAFFFIILHAFS